MSKIAFLFPGQGAQSVGMGKDLFENDAAARAVFEEIDSIAGRSLSRLCFEGPEEELKRTINTQPTILAVSLAALKLVESKGAPKPAYVAGHSLGEFPALVCCGALPVESVVPLVVKRAQLMEECPPGAMSAILGIPADNLTEICRQVSAEMSGNGFVVVVANFNTNDQLVISGSPEAVAEAGVRAKAAGGKVIPLPVGGAFHSPLMSSAADVFVEELDKYNFSDAKLPVVQNFDAKPSAIGSEIKRKLSQQMPNSVRWAETIQFMLSAGVTTFVEIGPGKALSGMVKKIDRSAKTININDGATLEAALQELSAASAVS
jgi:[acyl-carrier-protein] S-malonyltransferase